MDKKRKELLEKIAKLIDDHEFPNKEDINDGEDISCLIRFNDNEIEEYIYTGGEFELKSKFNAYFYAKEE